MNLQIFWKYFQANQVNIMKINLFQCLKFMKNKFATILAYRNFNYFIK